MSRSDRPTSEPKAAAQDTGRSSSRAERASRRSRASGKPGTASGERGSSARGRKADAPDAEEGRGRGACCMISELLEQSGVDREHIRQIRRQVLQGVMLLCQWQLERMEEARSRARAAAATEAGGEASSTRRGRSIKIE